MIREKIVKWLFSGNAVVLDTGKAAVLDAEKLGLASDIVKYNEEIMELNKKILDEARVLNLHTIAILNFLRFNYPDAYEDVLFIISNESRDEVTKVLDEHLPEYNVEKNEGK